LITEENIDDFVSKIKDCNFLSLDTETYGLEREDAPFAIIIGSPKAVGYLDLRCISKETINEKLGCVFQNKMSLWFLFNAKFDLQKLSMLGIDLLGTIHDCASAERIIDNIIPSVSMETVGAKYGFNKSDIVDKYVKQNKLTSYSEVPLPIMEEYATNDAVVTYAVGARQIASLTPAQKSLVDVERSITKVCYHMERVGIGVDVNFTLKANIETHEKIDKMSRDFESKYGAPLKTSGNALPDLLRAHNIPFKTNPKTKRPVLNSKELEKIDHPLIKDILEVRTLQKFTSTYFKPILEGHRDGVVYPNMRQDETVTGRFSYWGIGLQTLPKDEGSQEIFPVRRCFVPRDGYVFVAIDFDQQEMRLAADYANEKKLIDKILSGMDVHQATAELCGISRKQGKTINFAVIYGVGLENLGKMLGVSKMQAGAIRSRYFRALPKIQKLIEDTIANGRVTKKVVDCYGRIYKVESSEYAYKLPNYLIQGTGGGIMKRAMIGCGRFLWGKKSRMVATVHDELLFEVHKSELDIVDKLKDIMQNIYVPQNGMKLTCSVEWSEKSWQDKNPWNPLSREKF
jgi:DNA polymerase-1